VDSELFYVQPELEGLGPRVDLEVCPSTYLSRMLLAQGRRVPPPVVVTAIVDTGATWCAFKPEVFATLGIAPYDCASVSTSSTVGEGRYLYDVDLDFNVKRIVGVQAIESPLRGCPADGLIGRNILRVAELIYQGAQNCFRLRFV
jgi:hypothetical protein